MAGDSSSEKNNWKIAIVVAVITAVIGPIIVYAVQLGVPKNAGPQNPCTSNSARSDVGKGLTADELKELNDSLVAGHVTSEKLSNGKFHVLISSGELVGNEVEFCGMSDSQDLDYGYRLFFHGERGYDSSEPVLISYSLIFTDPIRNHSSRITSGEFLIVDSSLISSRESNVTVDITLTPDLVEYSFCNISLRIPDPQPSQGYFGFKSRKLDEDAREMAFRDISFQNFP